MAPQPGSIPGPKTHALAQTPRASGSGSNCMTVESARSKRPSVMRKRSKKKSKRGKVAASKGTHQPLPARPAPPKSPGTPHARDAALGVQTLRPSSRVHTAYSEVRGAVSEVQNLLLGPREVQTPLWAGSVGLEPWQKYFSENVIDQKVVTQLMRLAITIGGFKDDRLTADRLRGVNLEDFRHAMEYLSPQEALALFNEINTDQNGVLSRLEIICYLCLLQSEINDKTVKQDLDAILCFHTYSRPGSNNQAVLTAEDLTKMLISLLKCTTYKDDGRLGADSQVLVSRLLKGFSSDKKNLAYINLDDFMKALQQDAQTFMPVLDMWRFLLAQEQHVAKALALERQRLCVCCPADLLRLDTFLASSFRYVEDLCVIC